MENILESRLYFVCLMWGNVLSVTSSNGAGKKKGVFAKYPRSISVLVVALFFVAYNQLINRVNNIPEQGDIEMVKIKVLQIFDEKNYHLIALVNGGGERRMNFPDTISFFDRGFRGLPKISISQIAGCEGWAEVTPLKYVRGDILRIWSFDCGGVKVGRDKMMDIFKKRMETNNFMQAMLNFTILAIIGVCFAADRRDLK